MALALLRPHAPERIEGPRLGVTAGVAGVHPLLDPDVAQARVRLNVRHLEGFVPALRAGLDRRPPFQLGFERGDALLERIDPTGRRFDAAPHVPALQQLHDVTEAEHA